MALDPSIILNANPNATAGPDPEKMLTLRMLGQKLQMQNQAMQGQNALRQVLSSPQAYDPAGNLTPQALQSVTAADPATGLQLRQTMLEDQVKKAQIEHYKTDTGAARFDFMSTAAGAGISAYDDAKKSGKSEQDAISSATSARNEAIKNNGGLLGDEDVNKISSSPFQPEQARALAGTSKSYQQDRSMERQDRVIAERERHDAALEGLGAQRISAAAAKGDATLSDDEKKMMAQQYLAGDKSVMQNIGRGVQGASNIVALRGEIAKQAAEQGMDGKDIAANIAEFGGLTSGERTLGARTANVGLAVDEAKKLAPLAVDASRTVSRSAFVPISKAEQMVQKGTNDENIRRFVAANNSLINVYARGISPTGTPTVSDKEHGREMLDTAFDQKSYEAVVDQMMKEMAAAQEAPGEVRKELRAAVTGKKDTEEKKTPAADGWSVKRVQ